MPLLDPDAIDAVLFDVDGTLRDTDDELIHAVTRAGRPVLGEARARRWARAGVLTAERATQVAFGLADRVGLDGPLNRLVHLLGPRGATEAVPGAVDAVTHLARRYSLGIVSVGPARTVERFLREHGLADAMGVVVSGQTVSRTKPHPDPVLHAARRLGVAPQRCLMIGDTTVDIKAGRRAGAWAAGVLSGFGRETDLRRDGAHVVLRSVAELPGALGIGPAGSR